MPQVLGKGARRLIVGSRHTNHVCAVSTLEIARLVSTRHIEVSIPLQNWIEQSLEDLAAETVPVTHEIALEAYRLPGRFHKDPADRLLVATARHLNLILVTADSRILNYSGVSSRDARL